MNDSGIAAMPPWEGQPYSIKRHGVTITNCDSEPVQTPGCIQAHGALLVVRPADLTILQASENTIALLGTAAAQLLGWPVAAVLGEERVAQLQKHLDEQPTDRNPLYLFTLPARTGMAALDVTVHTIDGVAVLEMEAAQRGLNIEPDYYRLVKKIVANLQGAANLQQFCNIVADEIRELTGLDRVMIYKFHADGHGEVFAESREGGVAPWLGLHYPAADIPKPARDVFLKTWIRPIPDIAGELAELLPLLNPDTGKPLEMTYCALRGASIMYTEYLANMKVTAGLTLPIRRGEELWGLIACHHYAGPKHLPYQLRAACEFVAQVASLQHKAAEDREHLAYRLKLDDAHQKLVAAASREGHLAAMIAGDITLLDGMDATGAALHHGDRWWRLGDTPSELELSDLASWLTALPALTGEKQSLYSTDCLLREFPVAAAYARVASGMLALPLARGGNNWILWFRPETIHTVNWGGNPDEKPTVTGPHGPRLTPRRSFELFAQSVEGRSLPWRAVELETAARFRFLLMEMVIGRAAQLAELNAELLRSNDELDAFAYVASHDLKEPLRGIHMYAHQLVHDTALVDEAARRKLDLLMRLTLRMDSLIDSLLHFSRVGRVELVPDDADLNGVLAEALEMVSARATPDALELVVPRRLPTIRCDWVRCREVFVNLLSNALKYTDKQRPRIEVGYIDRDQAAPRPRCPASAVGQTILYVKDDGIGIAERHFEQVFKMFKRLHDRDEFGGGTGAGLTIVRKLVERHRGQVWIDSTLGEGTTFYFTLPGDDPI
jgi:two-component system, chemotaxis family, sensor kinase Cph1